MRLLFGKPLDDLRVEDVEAFLAEATEEGLTWEAKGNKQPHRDSVRKAVAGFANAVGGYLIMGAERKPDGGGWHLPGVAFRADEPGTWVSSVVTSGMSPVPSFEAKVFERENGRWAVVVKVEPVPVPPCITSDGILYQRVSGQTLPVTDRQVLTDLLRRGDTARANAETTARRAAERILQQPGQRSPDEALLSVSFSPVFGPEDKAAVIFSKPFAEKLHEAVYHRLQASPAIKYPVGSRMQQDAFRMWTAGREAGESWTAVAYWDGACAAVFTTTESELYINETVKRVHQAWRVLADITAELGGRGAAHLVVRVNEQHPMAADKLSGPVELRRWTQVAEPAEEELAGVEREVERAFGQHAWESSSSSVPTSG